MRIFGFHDGAACGYYRMLLPLHALGANGHEVNTGVGWHDEAREYDVIVGERIGKSSALSLWRNLYPGRKLVWETDDDLWAIDPTNIHAYMAKTPDVVDAIDTCIQMSHMVTVSTEPLAEVLRKRHDNVVVLPNYVDEEILSIQRPRRDRVTIGWAGGDSHLKDLAMVTRELRRFFKRNEDVDFHTMGTDYRKVLGLPGRFTPWHHNPFNYYRDIDFDIGIAPLERTPFNRSKSYIKALEYACLGIPVVASDEAPYRDFVLDGVTGFLVRDEHEWSRRLWTLVNDEAMREEMGAKARQHAANFTIQRNWWRWEKAYEGLQ